MSVTVRHVHDPQELLVKPEQEVKWGQLLADLRASRGSLLNERQVIQAQFAAAQALVQRLRLKHQQELALKRTEDALAGTHRTLAAFQAQQAQELLRAQAEADVASAKLERLDRQLAATTIRSPVSGRILAIRLHQSTATLHLLAHD